MRVRTLGFAVEYAGIRVRETTTADETIALVSSKLRLDSNERARRKMVMVYPLRSERARRGFARWRVRTLRGDEALLPLRRRRRAEGAEKEVRFYLHDELSTPLDVCELPKDEDASGSESSEDERPPNAKFVGDRNLLASRRGVDWQGTLLKRSEQDPNLWRRRRCVVADDRLFFWRETEAPRVSIEDERTTAEEYERDRVARSTCASIPLASNQVTEVVGRRDVPHGVEIATASNTLVFRADDRASQLEWLSRLRSAVEVATQNEYFAIAEHIIEDEHVRKMNADLKKAVDETTLDDDDDEKKIRRTKEQHLGSCTTTSSYSYQKGGDDYFGGHDDYEDPTSEEEELSQKILSVLLNSSSTRRGRERVKDNPYSP